MSHSYISLLSYHSVSGIERVFKEVHALQAREEFLFSSEVLALEHVQVGGWPVLQKLLDTARRPLLSILDFLILVDNCMCC